MQKRLIVVALTAAITLPVSAWADNANFSFYGKINVDVESVKSDKVATPATTATSLNRLQSNASRFGFKGSEDLGDGLQAVYQFEAQIDSVNDKNAKTPFNGVRNSQIGLKGDYGTVFAGNWDTPYKTVHNKIELFDNTTVFSAINLVGMTGNGKNYNTRQNNVIQYWTPNLSGFTGQISYALDSAKTATVNKTAMSLSGAYENDMLYAGLGYESRADQTTTTKSDSATRLVGAFKFPDGQVGLMIERMSVANTLTTTASQSNMELAGSYKIGSSNLGASFAKNGNYNGVTNTGAKQLSLRYGYNFSKRTELYGAYTSLSNDTGANYGFYTGSATGSKQTGLGLGMIHSF
ncbi:MAG: porin [Gallionella sp.]